MHSGVFILTISNCEARLSEFGPVWIYEVGHGLTGVVWWVHRVRALPRQCADVLLISACHTTLQWKASSWLQEMARDLMVMVMVMMMTMTMMIMVPASSDKVRLVGGQG